MQKISLLAFFFLLGLLGCTTPAYDAAAETQLCTCETGPKATKRSSTGDMRGALLATRFATIEDLQAVVGIDYFPGKSSRPGSDSLVRLTHCSQGRQATSILTTGISQGDIFKAKKGNIWAHLELAWAAPYAVQNRRELKRIYILARRMPLLFGEGDMAFYDLAETSVAHINTPDLAFQNPRDTTEKGYINTFNHTTAQALITMIFSEKIADFIADLHERHAMPALISGDFTPEQLTDPNDNAIDNYVDMVNNEWGQEIGKELKQKYGINRETNWTPELLVKVLNDLQGYYSWALQIGFQPYQVDDEVVVTFAHKINLVLHNNYVL